MGKRMLDLSKRILLSCVSVGGKEYRIRTDFRLWLSFGRLMKAGAPLREFDLVYEWNGLEAAAPADRAEGLKALAEFYDPPCPLPRPSGRGGEPLVDFEQDADLIYSAFWERYGIRLTEADLHWHEFLALFRGLKETKLNDVMGWRSFEPDGSKGMEKWNSRMLELKRAWALDTEWTEADKANLASFNARFE